MRLIEVSATNPLRRVLVLCTGNSCRSIIAEALINAYGAERFEAFSAGSRPTGRVHPRALRTLERHGIQVRLPRSKSWDEFAGQRFDCVVTVCDSAARETCPIFAGEATRLHWSTWDPADARGSDAEIDAAFERTFRELKERVLEELL